MNDTTPLRDVTPSEVEAPKVATAYLDDAPDDLLQVASMCFPQLRWESQAHAEASYRQSLPQPVTPPPQKRNLLGRAPPPPAPAPLPAPWLATLTSLDCLVYWGEPPRELPSTRAALFSLEVGPFGRDGCDPELSVEARNLVLRPIGLRAEVPSLADVIGVPDLALPGIPGARSPQQPVIDAPVPGDLTLAADLREDESLAVDASAGFSGPDMVEASPAEAAPARSGVAAIGGYAVALHARDTFPDEPVTALVTRGLSLNEQIELAERGIAIASGVSSTAPLLAHSAKIVTDVLEVAVAARAHGVELVTLGDASGWPRLTERPEPLAGAPARLDGRAYYGFVGRSEDKTLTHADVASAWHARIGSAAEQLALVQPLEPRTVRTIVVGQPSRSIDPFARHFGEGAWQKTSSATLEALQGAAARLEHAVLAVYARDRNIVAWCRSGIGKCTRAFQNFAIDFPMALTLSDVHAPAFVCHRIEESGEAVRYALAVDVDALSAEERAHYAAEGARLRPQLKRLQTMRRLARFNRVEMGRRLGPLGYLRVLVLGNEEDGPPAIVTNPEKVPSLHVIKAALAAHPSAKILYMPQKKALADPKHLAAAKALDPRVQVLDTPYGIAELAHVVSEVHTVDSQIGVLAIALGLPVVTYGDPAYAGLGVTCDLDASGKARPPKVAQPLDVDTFIGWYFRTSVMFADTFDGTPVAVDTYLEEWTPYLGELPHSLGERLTAVACDPKRPASEVQQVLRVLTAHGRKDLVDRVLAAREPSVVVAQNAALALDLALAVARGGDWREGVSLLFKIWSKHRETMRPKVFDALVKSRALLNSTVEIKDFDHFLLSTFRSMPGTEVESLGNEFLGKRFFETALTLFRTCTVGKTLLASLARCYIGLGRLVEAQETLAELEKRKEAPATVDAIRLALLEKAGRLDEAVVIMRQQALKEPTNFPQKLQLAGLLRDAGRLPEAVDVLLPLIRSTHAAAAVRALASIYITQMEVAKARGLLEAQINLTPTDAICWKLLGQVHSFENRLVDACNCLFMALTLSPLDIAAYTLLTELEDELAKSGKESGHWLASFDALLAGIDQCTIETLVAHGRIRLTVHDFETMKAHCVQGMRLFPEDARPHMWYAHALAWEMSEKTPEVIGAIRRHYGVALARDQEDNTWSILDTIRSLAKVGDINGIRDLVREYETSLYVTDRERLVVPRYSAALATGDFLTAFDGMRDFQRQRVLKRNARTFRLARSIEDIGWRDRVMFLSEGGVGDEIRYATMYPELIAKFPDAVISVDERLLTLFQRSFPMVKRFVSLPRYHRKRINKDLLHSIGSLPDRDIAPFADDRVWKIAAQADVVLPVPCALADLRATEQDFTRGHGVRLVPRADLVERWRERLKPYADKLIVGATWTSMFREYQRVENYLTHEEMAPLFTIPGTVFVNCQYENIDAELAWARDTLGVEILDFPDLDKRDDFEGLAAMFSALDLFVGVGTTTMEFAAIIGCNTIFASPICLNAYRNPDGSERDLYFSNVRLIRPIPATDRPHMIARIGEITRQEIAKKRTRSASGSAQATVPVGRSS